MRYLFAILCLTVTLQAIQSNPLLAQDPAHQAARMQARGELELAKQELRHYWQIDYPRQRRYLDAQIQLTEREIRNYKERLRAYEPYSRFSTGQPFLVTLQELRMCLLDAELRLRDLWEERLALMRLHSTQWRVLEQNVHQARLRVAELEAEDDSAELDTPTAAP
jgi:hypothetical protein